MPRVEQATRGARAAQSSSAWRPWCPCLAQREARADTRSGIWGEGPTRTSFWFFLIHRLNHSATTTGFRIFPRVIHWHPRPMNAQEAWEFLGNEDAQQGHRKCILDEGLPGSLTLQGPRTGRERDTPARITMARTGSLEGQEGFNGPARQRGHSESPIFIDTAMTGPGTAVNQRNCRE